MSFPASDRKGCREDIGVSPQSSSSVSEAERLVSECRLRKGEGDRDMLIKGIDVCGLGLTEDILERGLSSVSILPEEVLCRCLDFGLPSEMR